ncbi:hypothetical protein FRC12_024837 [Ceratobasidium sp. 428]|nr:hypothetical protein FRC12_024837 [Ceratobasidium sp. 428]
MPVERAIQSRRLHRPSPLPKAHYTIPKRLPSPFGVDELFDWSSSRGPTHSGSSRSTSTRSQEQASLTLLLLVNEQPCGDTTNAIRAQQTHSAKLGQRSERTLDVIPKGRIVRILLHDASTYPTNR